MSSALDHQPEGDSALQNDLATMIRHAAQRSAQPTSRYWSDVDSRTWLERSIRAVTPLQPRHPLVWAVEVFRTQPPNVMAARQLVLATVTDNDQLSALTTVLNTPATAGQTVWNFLTTVVLALTPQADTLQGQLATCTAAFSTCTRGDGGANDALTVTAYVSKLKRLALLRDAVQELIQHLPAASDAIPAPATTLTDEQERQAVVQATTLLRGKLGELMSSMLRDSSGVFPTTFAAYEAKLAYVSDLLPAPRKTPVPSPTVTPLAPATVFDSATITESLTQAVRAGLRELHRDTANDGYGEHTLHALRDRHDSTVPRCFNCNNTGHIARDCRLLRRVPAPAGLTCRDFARLGSCRWGRNCRFRHVDVDNNKGTLARRHFRRRSRSPRRDRPRSPPRDRQRSPHRDRPRSPRRDDDRRRDRQPTDRRGRAMRLAELLLTNMDAVFTDEGKDDHPTTTNNRE